MELLQLRYFYESAQSENFSKTAQRYMVPTTSVSSSVKRLEKELGCTLFDRESNRIRLNENGKKLQRSLYAVFDTLDSTVNSLKHAEDRREIKILVHAMRRRITDAIIAFRSLMPEVSFQTTYDFSRADYDNFDIVIDEKESAISEYRSFPLYEMDIGLKTAADSALKGKALTLSQLSGQPFLSMGEQSNMHRMLFRACARAGFTPHISVYSNDSQCYDRLIEAGMGIGLSRRDGKSGKCIFLDVKDFHEKYTVYVYYRESSAYGAVREFLDFLKSNAYG